MTNRFRAAAAVIVVLCAATAAADYLEPYRRGFNAFNLFRWEAAAGAMREAIAQNPTESGKDVHIQLLAYKPYVPHFYLGISLAKLGRCSEAVPALRESLRQGQVPNTRGYRQRAERTLQECLATMPEQTEPEPAPVSGAETVVPSPTDLEVQTNAEPTPPVATPTDAASAPPVEQKESSQVQITPEVEQEEPRQAAPVRSKPPETLLAAPRPASPAAAELGKRTAAPDLPPSLVAGVDAYLRGRYAEAVRLLDGAVLQEEPQRAYAFLFRAAALHALFVLGQRRDMTLQARASLNVLEYSRLRPRASADARVFSPLFLQFLQTAR